MTVAFAMPIGRQFCRRGLLSASALAVLCAAAPDVVHGQALSPSSQPGIYGNAPMSQAEAMQQIQQMQQQMLQLQQQIQQLQAQRNAGAPARPAGAAPQPVQPSQMGQPMIAPATAVRPTAAAGRAARPAVQRQNDTQRKPLAASVFTQDSLDERGIADTQDLAPFVPNMLTAKSQGLGMANDTFIRGLGTTDHSVGFDPAVGTYVDGIYLSRTNFTNFDFFPVERVEVLRGPQGTASPQQNVGGAIHIAFQKPQLVMGGGFEVGYGRFNSKLVRGHFNAPVSETVRTQIAGYFNDDKGYVKNTTTGDRLNDVRNYGVRVAAEVQPFEALTWNAAVNHTYANELNVLNFQCRMFGTIFTTPGAPTPAADCGGRFARTALRRNTVPSVANLTVVTPGGSIPTTLANVKSERKVGAPTRSTLFSSDVAYDINDTTRLNFVTGYIDLSQAYVFDLQDGRPGRSLATPNPATPIQPAAPNGYYTLSGKQRTSQVSQDVRLAGDLLNGAIEYTAGLSYLDARERADTADIVLGVVEADRLIKNRHRVAAAYLSTDLHVTQNFTFAAGIRYTIDKKRLDLRDLRDAAAVPVVAGVPRPDLRLTTANLIAAGRPDRQKEKGFSPRVTLSYAFGPDALTYVSATRGIRAGGWNVHGRTVDTFTAFAPERAWTYEAGAKTSWLGEALTANVAVFNTDITDKQVSSTFTTAAAIPSYTTANPSNYRVRGLETEVQARPFDGFLAYANLAYQSASYKSPTQATSTLVAACRGLVAAGQAGLGVCGTSIVTPAGLIAKPVRAPKFSGTAGLSVDMPTGFGIVFAPAFSLTYQSRWQNDAANTSFYASADPATTPTAVTTRPNATGGSGFIAGSRSGSVYLLNASLAVGTDDGLWRGVLECTNCLGKTYATSSIAGHSFLNEPMRWGVRIKRSF